MLRFLAPALVAVAVAAGNAAPAAAAPIPRAACVARAGGGLVAVFDVRAGRRAVVRVGRRNRVVGGRVLGRQPTSFERGLTRAALRVVLVRRRVVWRLGGRTAALGRRGQRCPRPTPAARPTITGQPRVGASLTAHPGRWRDWIGGVRYRWQRKAGAGWTAAGGSAARRVLGSADTGATLRVVVSVRGRGGWSAAVGSAAVGPVAGVPVAAAPITTTPTAPVPTLRPIFAPTSFWNTTIPADVALATDRMQVGTAPDGTPVTVPVNPTVAQELAADSRRADGSSNARIYYHAFTAPITIVPATTPLEPIRLCRSYPSSCVSSWARPLDQTLRGVAADGTYLGGGVPIPAGFSLPTEGDRQAILYQPDYVAPDGTRGRLYELWGLQPNPDYDPAQPVSPTNTRLMASWGGRMVGVTGEGAGYWRDCWWSGCGYEADTSKDPDAWGRPDSQAQEHSWGATASSLPLLGSEISLPECRSGVINHAIGIEVPAARRQFWWPAQRTDGLSWTTTLTEGMRLTFPAGAVKPANLTALGSSLWDAAKRYGLVIDDQSGSAITLRVEPGCESTAWWGSADAFAQLANFPWNDLRVIAHP